MKEKTKQRLVIALALVATGFVLLNVLAYNHAHAMMHFAATDERTSKPEDLSFWRKVRVLLVGVNIPRPVSSRSPADLSPDCQVVSISSSDGTELEGWYCDQGEETPLVIFFHGYTAEKTSLLPEAKSLLDLGVSVMLVDFRGSGGSSESYTTIGVREGDDVAAVARYARGKLTHSAIILYGQSMGAAAILRAAHEHGINPDAVVLTAVFDTMQNMVNNRFAAMGVPSFPSAQLLAFWGGRQWGFNAFAHNPVDYAKSLTCPTLVMHGVEDARAKLEEAQRVFAALPGTKEFRAFESVGHETYIEKYPAEWKSAVESLIRGLAVSADSGRASIVSP